VAPRHRRRRRFHLFEPSGSFVPDYVSAAAAAAAADEDDADDGIGCC
jgi:hypothetical protein